MKSDAKTHSKTLQQSPGKPRVEGLQRLEDPEGSSTPQELNLENQLSRGHSDSQRVKWQPQSPH